MNTPCSLCAQTMQKHGKACLRSGSMCRLNVLLTDTVGAFFRPWLLHCGAALLYDVLMLGTHQACSKLYLGSCSAISGSCEKGMQICKGGYHTALELWAACCTAVAGDPSQPCCSAQHWVQPSSSLTGARTCVAVCGLDAEHSDPGQRKADPSWSLDSWWGARHGPRGLAVRPAHR